MRILLDKEEALRFMAQAIKKELLPEGLEVLALEFDAFTEEFVKATIGRPTLLAPEPGAEGI